MNKKLLGVLTGALVMGLLLVGCGSGNKNNATTETTTATQTTTTTQANVEITKLSGITFAVPSSWAQSVRQTDYSSFENKVKGASLESVEFDLADGDSLGYVTQINLPATADKTQIEQLFAELRQVGMAALEKVSNEQTTSQTVGGETGEKTTFDFTASGVPAYGELTLVTHGQGVYMIFAIGPSSAKTTIQDGMDMIYSTAQFK